MTLSRDQKKYLVGICHHLKPVVTVAAKGLSASVTAELEQALDHHELIKVKLRGDRDDRGQWIEGIQASTGAELVQKIGMTACFFRRNAEDPKLELPR